jgi:hypothetical protein
MMRLSALCAHTHSLNHLEKPLSMPMCGTWSSLKRVLHLHCLCCLSPSHNLPPPPPPPSPPQLLSGFQFMICFFFSLHLGCSIVQVLSCALCFASCPSHFSFQHPETHSYVQTSLNLSSWIVYALFNLVFGE